MENEQRSFRWGHDALHLEFVLGDDGSARLTHLGLPGEAGGDPGASLPLVEVTAAGQGRGWSGSRLIGTALGGRLRHRAHRAARDGDWHTLTVYLHDPETGLAAEVVYRSPDGIAVLRSEVTLRNEGRTTLHLESVSSLTVGCLTPQDPAAVDAADLLWAENDWLAECRWQRQPMRRTTPGVSGHVKYGHGKAGFALNGQGTWSSCGHLPMGGLTDRRTGRSWVWQIEHNGGGWRWECQEHDRAAYVALFGPTDAHHGWRHPLEPGAAFRTVPAALSFSADGGPDAAFAALTRYRRAHRRPHADHRRLPVIFNDYMNCLMGDPTTDKLLPLIDAAAEAGAEYFVIDAGWYDGDNGGWWTTVGAWEPAASRFPGEKGIHEVLDRIRERGMVPGRWLEPEVIGVHSPMAKSLPDEAFFRRDGVRLTETGRHHLDLRHPAARAHLDQVVDRLVGEWGVGYLKLDHNIDPGSGTSAHPGEAPGAGLLGHNRAHLDWLDGILDRHPQLVVENCASGGMRWDHALLSRLQLQSTSDQQNLQLYAPIAASAPTAVTPEQGAVWAYPQPEDSLDEVAFTMVSALLGRIHLSGHLPELGPEARALVHEAVAAYKTIRADLAEAVPSWPLGLPGWDDPWIALALHTPATTYLTVWRRPGGAATTTLRLPEQAGGAARAEVLYPAAGQTVAVWNRDTADLTVTLPTAPSAALLRISRTEPDAR
ncbi:alpha-galactosidase [Streptomyces viridochromogenes]|uniref:alpha-galactosidase n=1 Tax=Streptomyces viridochromogenes TaxID=1938 RepID=UPI00069CE79A|nr:alpha-galactosidase [Streptomyces viridochromogenes]KOG17675.1 alpha-galactosidase [Streptomyces viridochromogenes]KOG18128.1 alpha-galactosidase [Streptomyces viridochromogenes]